MAKILFFTTALEHTTYRKTAKMLQREGADIQLLGFTRKNYPVTRQDALSIHNLGQLSHGNYLSRIVRLLKTLPVLRKEAKNYDIIYNFTLDTFLISKIALLFTPKIWVYQIQDIRPIYFGNSWKNKFMRRLEKKFIHKADLVVVSSKNYFLDHFKPRYNLDAEKVKVIENKLIPNSIQPREKKDLTSHKNKLSLGYFGVLRCRRSWEILKETVQREPEKLFLYLRGKPMAIPHLKEEIKGIDNICYGGLYKSPDELNDLYNQVDLVWAAYPYSEERDGNWRYARTIRFYEALAFGKPVIIQKGTPQEEDVKQYKIGMVIDMKYPEKTVKQILHISNNEVIAWKKNICKLPPSYYYHDMEYADLLNRLEAKLKQ